MKAEPACLGENKTKKKVEPAIASAIKNKIFLQHPLLQLMLEASLSPFLQEKDKTYTQYIMENVQSRITGR